MKRIHIAFSQIQAFATVAQTKSFTLAGKQLGMTQSAVSHAISALEKELQVSLLERSREGMFLTAIGERVLIQAQQILSCVEQIRQETSASIGLETGRIRIGSFPSVSSRFLPGLLRQFRRRHPGIEVVLFEGTDDEVREWLYSQAVDVGVVVLPMDELEVLAIVQDEILAVVAINHPLAKEEDIHVRDFSDEPFIMSKLGCEPMIMSLFKEAKVIPKIKLKSPI